MATQIRNKTISAFIWSGIEGTSRPFIQMVSGIILARILSPDDFGRFAMLSILIGLSEVFFDSGFGTALVQKQNPTKQDYTAVFYFNIAVAIFLYLIIAFSAPYIAKFYKEAILEDVTRIYALNILIRASSSTQITAIIKTLQFKKLTVITTISIIISSVIAVILAMNGWGIWALVAYSLVTNLVTSILAWKYSDWIPSKSLNFGALRQLFNFGSKIFVASILDSVFRNIYNIIIGKKFQSTILGFYDRAIKVQQLPVENLEVILHRVVFPVFSSMQHNIEKLRQSFVSMTSLLAYLYFPVLGLIAISSDSIILVLFGEKWLASAPFLFLLCIAGVFYPFISINNALIKSLGRSTLYLSLSVAYKIILLLSIVIFITQGVKGLIIGQFISSFLIFVIHTTINSRIIDLNFFRIYRIISVYLALSISISWLSDFITNNLDIQPVFEIVLNAVIIALTYLIISYLLRLQAFLDIKPIAINKINQHLQKLKRKKQAN